MRTHRLLLPMVTAFVMSGTPAAARQNTLEGPTLLLTEGPAEAVAPPAPSDGDDYAPLERDAIYRYMPSVRNGRLGQRLTPVAADQLLVGTVYLHYSDRAGRHVWGLYLGDGQFRYELGEGSTLRVEFFDINLNEQERQEVLDAVAPRLRQKLEEPDRSRNVNLYLSLDDRNEWQLVGYSSLAKVQSVYDFETGQRWEWHGNHRHAVIHSAGDVWQVRNGRYVPDAIAATPIFCERRAGSALNVMRTPAR